MEQWITRLKTELAGSLPGTDAWNHMSPSVRRSLSEDKPLRTGGVLLLLYPKNSILHLVFIKRNEYKGVHSGQVSFPGGIHERHDRSIVDTALREAAEETGLNISDVAILGLLTPLHIPASNIIAHPVVGYTANRPAFRADPAEVRYLIEIELSNLLNYANHKKKTMKVAGQNIEVPYFDVCSDPIWGATAMILSEFLEVVRKTM